MMVKAAMIWACSPWRYLLRPAHRALLRPTLTKPVRGHLRAAIAQFVARQWDARYCYLPAARAIGYVRATRETATP